MTPQQAITALQGVSDVDQLRAFAMSMAALVAERQPSEKPEAPELLTVKESCAVLGGISKQTFYELTKHPNFPAAYRLNSRVVRYAKQDLLAYLETTKQHTPPAL